MLLHLLDLCGVAVFAVSGVLAAARKRMDLFGVLVIAAVTALGGGTLRDLLLGRRVAWVVDPTPLAVATAAALLTVAVARLRRIPPQALLVADALGLGLFSVTGAATAERLGTGPGIAVLLGALSAVAGGAIRDILSAEVPMILRQDIYATAAVAGAGAYVVLERSGLAEPALTPVAMTVAVALRLAAVVWGLQLPTVAVRE